MTDAEACLATLRVNSPDATLRLVFADWFDEHAQPERAAFIRVHGCMPPTDNDHRDPPTLSVELRLQVKDLWRTESPALAPTPLQQTIVGEFLQKAEKPAQVRLTADAGTPTIISRRS